VVIPAYGRVEPLKYTLKSAARALREAGGGGEIVVVDDGSEPPLEGQLQGFEAGHPVKFLRQKNQGSIVARMTGLAAAQGKYVLFLDSDDLIHPEKIRAQTKAMKESGAEVGVSDMAEARLASRRCDVPSIIHVDYSARLQTVRREVHPDFHRLITEFKKRTGVPIVINTSFNVSGQPIVRTAEEAWLCFQNTDMDYLVVNDEIYRNPNLKTREEKLQWLKQFAKHA
jgi:glycosyltransferase involved in cell wall biosynthesis